MSEGIAPPACDSAEVDVHSGAIWALRKEFFRYEARRIPEDYSLFEYDMGLPLGAQLVAVRLGYTISPRRRRGELYRLEHWQDHKRILELWDGDNRDSPIVAALRFSNVTSVLIDTRTMDGFIALARLEDCFGQLPRSRVMKTRWGYEIHMRGRARVEKDELGPGLTLWSGDFHTELPSSHDRDCIPRWLRVGQLEPAPEWLLGSCVKSTGREVKE